MDNFQLIEIIVTGTGTTRLADRRLRENMTIPHMYGLVPSPLNIAKVLKKLGYNVIGMGNTYNRDIIILGAKKCAFESLCPAMDELGRILEKKLTED